MPSKHIVVIGTSAGGIETLRELVAGLPADFPAPIVIVMHLSPESPDVLPDILTRSGPLRAGLARNGERLAAGTIHVAPADRHLLVEPGRLRLTRGPRENRFRPAIDPLFRSAAQVYGPRTIGVILSGNLDDGTAGLWAIKQLGGITIAQHPDTALFRSMPESAIRHVRMDYVTPLHDIPPLLARLASDTVPAPVRPAASMPSLDVEVAIAAETNPLAAGLLDIGEPSTFTCPECHGVLLRMREADRIRFRCHTGHAFSPQSLIAEVIDRTDAALWNTVRAMQEGAMLLRTLGEHLEQHHPGSGGTDLSARGAELQRQAETLRTMATAEAPGESEVSVRRRSG
jgi:two-component system chemotaxis response regulator CheB